MNKVLFQAGLSAAVFFGTWLLLGQLNWMSYFKVEESKDDLDEKLGALMIRSLEDQGMLVDDEETLAVLDSLLGTLAAANDFEAEPITIYLSRDEEINAFALPGNQIVINTGLIRQVEKPEELAGVMAHEVVHLKNNHVMKKLVRELGLSVLVGMTTGGAGSDVIKQAGHLLSSRAFDRELEQEADDQAVEILNNTGVSAEHLANFLYLLAEYNGSQPEMMAWLSTHPELKSRAERIVEAQDFTGEEKPVMSVDHWEQLKQITSENDLAEEME